MYTHPNVEVLRFKIEKELKYQKSKVLDLKKPVLLKKIHISLTWLCTFYKQNIFWSIANASW